MAYMNQEKKAKIAENLKKALKGTGVKYSLSVSNHLAIVCTIKSAPVDFIANSNETCQKDFYQVARGFKPNESGYEQVNTYHYKDHSDAQTDYFNTAYYVHLNVGRWNKPFEVSK